jgi:hypothetical protein
MFVASIRERFALVLSACTALTCVVTTSCSRGPEDTPQTVDYYRTHPKDRQALLALCANDPGRLGSKPACINAQQAESVEGIGSMRSLPPMGLSQGGTIAPGGGAPPTAPPNK